MRHENTTIRLISAAGRIGKKSAPIKKAAIKGWTAIAVPTTSGEQIPPTLTGEQFDEIADSGADLSAYMDDERAIRAGRAVQRVNVDFPIAMLRAIDADANRIGVTRQAWIKMRLAESLK
jgi:hypothetical protein